MSMQAFFERLGAPLRVVRTSWGGEGPRGIFLRAWQDEFEKLPDGRRGVLVSWSPAEDNGTTHFGRNERREHVAKIKDGARGYVIMCVVEDPKADPRQIRSFNQREIFPINEIVEIDGNNFAVLDQRIAVRDFLKSDQ